MAAAAAAGWKWSCSTDYWWQPAISLRWSTGRLSGITFKSHHNRAALHVLNNREMLSVTLECETLCNICTYPSFLPSFLFCQMHNKTLSLPRSQTAKAGVLSSTNLWNDSADISAKSFSFVNLHPQGEEKSPASPGDWPETQLASRPDCISIEQTTSYQTSQWRERSEKWKLMNTSQVTVAQRQFTTDMFRKIQEAKDRLSKCSGKSAFFFI